MSPKSLFTFLVSIGMISLTACTLISGTDKKDSGNANMPNPASVFCEENGGTLEIRTDDDGSQSGVCVFPDGSECDEWAFFRSECKHGDSLTNTANMPNPASVFCEDNGGTLEIRTAEDGSQSGVCVFPDDSECDEWAFFRSECKHGDSLADNPVTAVDLADDGCTVYRDKDLQYSFHYPSDAIISENDEPAKSFSIQGPVFEDNYWPVIMIAHPQDREEYRPREGSDLKEWLANYNLIDAETYDVIEIAGTTAVHTRIDSKSGQSYNFDHYYFAHADQLYSIVILHTNGKEDWDLYNHFLSSFQFEP
jgi:putative hemolysin